MDRKDYTALLSERVWPRVERQLLGGIADRGLQRNLKTVLANTRSALLADTSMQNMIYLPKIVLPLVRRLFPKLIANQIISVQPLNGPTGWIRFLDAFVEHINGSTSNIYPWGVGDNTYSTPQTAVVDNILANGSGNTAKSFSGTLSKIPSEGTLFVEVGNAATVAASTTFTKIAEVDRNGVIHALSSSYKVVGVVDPATRAYAVSITTSADAAVQLGLVFSYKEDIQKNIPFGNNKTYNTMRFNITKVAVEAKTRKLGATYSFELMEDYKNEFGENFEDKMVDYLTTTILTEVDSEVIDTLFNRATVSGSWDATMPMTWTRGINQWYETVLPKINKLSNYIYQATHVSGATFLVCSPVTATIFQSLMQFSGNGTPTDQMNVGTVNIGTLNGVYKVFTSPLCPDNKVLLGFKGSKPEDTGAVYAPYVPVQLHPIYYSEGMPSVMARTRYWLGVLRPDYYGVLNINGTI